MKHQPPPQGFGPSVNRLADCLIHVPRYSFKGVTRLAQDAGVHKSTVSRLLNGRQNASYLLVARVGDALSRELGRTIDLRELIAERGEFPTPYVCDLMGCRGCLPPNATDEFGSIKQAFHGVEPGRWVTSRHPRGLGKEVR